MITIIDRDLSENPEAYALMRVMSPRTFSQVKKLVQSMTTKDPDKDPSSLELHMMLWVHLNPDADQRAQWKKCRSLV